MAMNSWLKIYHSRLYLTSGLSAQCKEIHKKPVKVYAYTWRRSLHSSQEKYQAQKDATLLPTPQEVTAILRKNEYNQEFASGSVKSYDSNQLASNNPIEDTRSEALCRLTDGLLVGVFDGHGGPACAQVISKRLLQYVAAALLPQQALADYERQGAPEPLIQTYNDKVQIVDDLNKIYDKSFKEYLKHLVQESVKEPDVQSSLEKAILRLDNDFSREVLEPFAATGEVNPRTLSVAMSGAVVCVAHVAGPHLHVANVGDCAAVLGVHTEENEWIAKKITRDHNSDNYDELKRIWSEHPQAERNSVVRRDRLLGELAPLRSLGDYRYKWSAHTLADVAVPLAGPKAIPANYFSPPYLSARPDLFHHRLTHKDKFLIIASDGIWDMMTPVQAVKLVGEHMKGKVFFNPLKLPKKDIALGDINELLLHRKESLKSKPKDRNAATHLVRHALGGAECGEEGAGGAGGEEARMARLLALPAHAARMFRDDMTAIVVFFDSEHVRQCPT